MRSQLKGESDESYSLESFVRQNSFCRFKLSKIMKQMPDFSIFVDYQNKATRLAPRKTGGALNNRKKGTSFHLLEENAMTVQFSQMFFRAHPLSKTFVKHTNQLIASGLVTALEDFRSFIERISRKEENHQNPRSLTMSHLGVCFIAILICLAVSCFVFFIECFGNYLTSTR